MEKALSLLLLPAHLEGGRTDGGAGRLAAYGAHVVRGAPAPPHHTHARAAQARGGECQKPIRLWRRAVLQQFIHFEHQPEMKIGFEKRKEF